MKKYRDFCLFAKPSIFWMGVPVMISLLTLPAILNSFAIPLYIGILIVIFNACVLGYFVTIPLTGLLTMMQFKSMYGERTLKHIEKWLSGESADEKYDLDIESIARAYGELKD